MADGGEGLEGQGDVLLPLEAVERDDGALFVVLMVHMIRGRRGGGSAIEPNESRTEGPR